MTTLGSIEEQLKLLNYYKFSDEMKEIAATPSGRIYFSYFGNIRIHDLISPDYIKLINNLIFIKKLLIALRIEVSGLIDSHVQGRKPAR